MGSFCKGLGEECSIKKLGLCYPDSRAFTDAPVSDSNDLQIGTDMECFDVFEKNAWES